MQNNRFFNRKIDSYSKEMHESELEICAILANKLNKKIQENLE